MKNGTTIGKHSPLKILSAFKSTVFFAIGDTGMLFNVSGMDELKSRAKVEAIGCFSKFPYAWSADFA